MTPEGRVKEKIKAILKERGAYYHMPVQNGMGSPTLDFVVCYKGRFLAIEAKAGNKLPTLRQEVTIDKIVAAKGKAIVVNEDSLPIAMLIAWLDSIDVQEELRK